MGATIFCSPSAPPGIGPPARSAGTAAVDSTQRLRPSRYPSISPGALSRSEEESRSSCPGRERASTRRFASAPGIDHVRDSSTVTRSGASPARRSHGFGRGLNRPQKSQASVPFPVVRGIIPSPRSDHPSSHPPRQNARRGPPSRRCSSLRYSRFLTRSRPLRSVRLARIYATIHWNEH